MREEDYLLAQNLTRLRIADDVLREVSCFHLELTGPIKVIRALTDKLYRELEQQNAPF